MEIEVKQRNRRRKRAQRMQQQLKETHANKATADESETEDVIPKKPPRPPNRRKKQKDLFKEPLCEEDVIEGFSILQFRTYEDLEVSFAKGYCPDLHNTEGLKKPYFRRLFSNVLLFDQTKKTHRPPYVPHAGQLLPAKSRCAYSCSSLL